MNIDKDIVERTFELVGEGYGSPVLQEDEVTARMMHDKYPDLSERQWMNRLKKAVKEGKYTVRTAKQNRLAFKPVDE